MKDKTFVTLAGIFFLLFVIGIGAVTLNQPITTMLRAKNAAVSPLKSFGVVFPQIATVGDTQVKISIYVRGVDGSILANRNVRLSSDPAILTIAPSENQITNEIGQAEFTVTSQTAGKVRLIAKETTSNTDIINIPSVEFVQ